MTTISPRRAQTRERLVNAAFHVLAREGLAGASIEMIVEEAGFTRGAFYSNFSDKEELFAAVLDNEMRKRIQAVFQAVQELQDKPAEQPFTPNVLADLLRRVIVDPASEREWQIIMTEFELYSLRNPSFAKVIPQPDLAYLDDIAEILLPVMESWGIEFTAEPKVALRLLINGYVSAERQALRSHPEALSNDLAPSVKWFTVLVEKFLREQTPTN